MDKLRILLIEDNRLLRDGIADLINKHGEFEVVARSDDGDAVEQLKNLGRPPEIVLLDLGLEKVHSAELMKVLRKELPEARIIAMDIVPEHTDIVDFVKAGGRGFILKDAPFSDYIATIRAVSEGARVLPPIMTKSLFLEILETTIVKGPGAPDESILLTSREQEVVALISEGLSNKEIAERLHIATHTVKSHVHNILEKLTLSTRLEIAAFAHRGNSE